jgi:hypothetical protein
MDLDSSSASDTHAEGACLSTASFYADWAIRFTVPLLMAVVAVALCLTTKTPVHQVRPALVRARQLRVRSARSALLRV